MFLLVNQEFTMKFQIAFMSWFFLQHKLCNFYPELMTLISNLFLVNQKQHDQSNLIPKHMILMSLHFLVNQKHTASPVKFDSRMNDFCEPIMLVNQKTQSTASV